MLEFCTSGSVGGLGGRPPRPTRTIVRLFIVVRLELMTKQCGFQTAVLTAEKTSESLLLTTKRLFSLDIVVVRQPGDPPRLAQAAVLGAVGLNDIHSPALDPGLKRLPTRQHLAPGDWYGRDLRSVRCSPPGHRAGAAPQTRRARNPPACWPCSAPSSGRGARTIHQALGDDRMSFVIRSGCRSRGFCVTRESLQCFLIASEW